MSSFCMDLEYKVRQNIITKTRAFEYVNKFFEILGLTSEWESTEFNEDDLWEYLQTNPLRIMDYPYSNEIDLEHYCQLLALSEEYLDYRPLTIYRKVGKDKYQPLTDQHIVGRMFNIRDYHDTEHGNSSSSEVEKNSQGFANNKDNSKKTGRALYAKKGVKMDVQFQNIALNRATNADATIMLADPNDESAYGITEVAEASGIKIQLGTDRENIDILLEE